MVEALAMPWDVTFDPQQELLKFYPVWIVLQDVPAFLFPHPDCIAGRLGQVLYLLKCNFLVPSRNIKLSVLWDMTMPISDRLQVDFGLEHPLYIGIEFKSFPHACYKGHSVGHFAARF